jgi:hypothetical protein
MPRLYRALVMGVCAAVFCGASSATAQGQLSAVEVRQIVDNALEVVLPRDTRLSGVSVEQRNIYFDHAKTLDAFGLAPTVPLGQLPLQRPVEDATPDLLEDCSGFGRIFCTQLGQGVYVSVSPASNRRTASELTVWVHVWWTTRSADQPPDEHVRRMGFSSELFFARSPSGSWEFIRTGRTAVS